MKKPKVVQLRIAAHPDLVRQLRAAAERDGRPLNTFIVRCLEASLRKDKADESLLPFTNYLLNRLVALGESPKQVAVEWHARSGRKQLTIELELEEDSK
jgi:hypothetical protein